MLHVDVLSNETNKTDRNVVVVIEMVWRVLSSRLGKVYTHLNVVPNPGKSLDETISELIGSSIVAEWEVDGLFLLRKSTRHVLHAFWSKKCIIVLPAERHHLIARD